MSAAPRSVPAEAEPLPQGAETTPPPGGITAPAVNRPAPPPGRAGGGRTPTTGANADPPAQIQLGTCGMMCRTPGAGRNGSPAQLPTPAPRMYRGTNPPRKRHSKNRKDRQRAAQPPAGSPHKLPAHALAGTPTTPGLLAPVRSRYGHPGMKAYARPTNAVPA